MQLNSSTIDSLICAVLSGKHEPWPWDADGSAAIQTATRADFHGVAALLYNQRLPPGWPDELVQSLRQQAIHQALWEPAHRHLLAEALNKLREVGIHPVLLKGTALAYSLYCAPVRSRGDTDLIIPAEARGRAHDLLLSMGWQRATGISGEFISYQATYYRHTADGALHALDLHWKINNSEVLSRLFDPAELLRDSRPLAALCPGARGTSDVHSLLIACMHRATHRTNPYFVDGVPHHTDDRLIWLVDIHLLAQRFETDDWRALVSLAQRKALCAVSMDALEQARARLGTTIPAFVEEQLTAKLAPERPFIYLAATKWRQQWMDFCALESWSQRLGLVSELLFPTAEYMRSKFGNAPGPLAWLYLRRAVNGIASRLPLGRRLTKLLAMPRAERRMLVKFAALAALFWLGLRFLGLARFHAWLQSSPLTLAGSMSHSDAQKLAELVDLAVRNNPFPITCLPRSLLLQWLLRRRGIATELRVGVRKENSELAAHAWVEYAGTPVNERADIATHYQPFERPSGRGPTLQS